MAIRKGPLPLCKLAHCSFNRFVSIRYQLPRYLQWILKSKFLLSKKQLISFQKWPQTRYINKVMKWSKEPVWVKHLLNRQDKSGWKRWEFCGHEFHALWHNSNHPWILGQQEHASKSTTKTHLFFKSVFHLMSWRFCLV